MVETIRSFLVAGLMCVLIFLTSCNSIKYKDDIGLLGGFVNSAEANSMEYMVRINKVLCRDMDSKIGLCTKRVSSKEEVKFHHDPRPYAYTFTLTCTSSMKSNFEVDKEEGEALDFSIKPEKFKHLKSFTCIGSIEPHDRPEELRAKWSVRFVVFDDNYIAREEAYYKTKKKKKYIVLGQYALHTTVSGKHYKEKTAVKVKSKSVKGYSESYLMRFNYYGY